MIGLAVLLALIGLPLLFGVLSYNALVRLRNAIRAAWSQIDVQLKRRHDLVPNLVETVKGYAGHERETLDAVVRARQQAVQVSGDVAAQIEAENALSRSLRSLFAVAEAYPDLKANQSFLGLQEELTSTENRIAFARQYYNDVTLSYNNKVESFPSSVIAGMFGFTRSPFFELEDPAQREVPRVDFSN